MICATMICLIEVGRYRKVLPPVDDIKHQLLFRTLRSSQYPNFITPIVKGTSTDQDHAAKVFNRIAGDIRNC